MEGEAQEAHAGGGEGLTKEQEGREGERGSEEQGMKVKGRDIGTAVREREGGMLLCGETPRA